MTDLSRRLFLSVLSVLALVSAGLAQPLNVQQRVIFPSGELTIESGGQRHKFSIELADTDERRTLGLMYRTSLAADAGMLFDFKMDQPVIMWMRNTRLPLDMLFITRDGRIANIAQRTVPFSETSIYSSGPVRAVLELNGGTAERLGIKPGDRVFHPMFRG
jgi:uncharacterized membrane protein (UPF0127 family)